MFSSSEEEEENMPTLKRKVVQSMLIAYNHTLGDSYLVMKKTVKRIRYTFVHFVVSYDASYYPSAAAKTDDQRQGQGKGQGKGLHDW